MPANENGPGRVVLAGAPLGNIGDASARLREVLASADVISAEDTRRLRNLITALGIATTARIVSYFDGNEAARADELLDDLRADVERGAAPDSEDAAAVVRQAWREAEEFNLNATLFLEALFVRLRRAFSAVSSVAR